MDMYWLFCRFIDQIKALYKLYSMDFIELCIHEGNVELMLFLSMICRCNSLSERTYVSIMQSHNKASHIIQVD